jgi:hypothetical protein
MVDALPCVGQTALLLNRIAAPEAGGRSYGSLASLGTLEKTAQLLIADSLLMKESLQHQQQPNSRKHYKRHPDIRLAIDFRNQV